MLLNLDLYIILCEYVKNTRVFFTSSQINLRQSDWPSVFFMTACLPSRQPVTVCYFSNTLFACGGLTPFSLVSFCLWLANSCQHLRSSLNLLTSQRVKSHPNCLYRSVILSLVSQQYRCTHGKNVESLYTLWTLM